MDTRSDSSFLYCVWCCSSVSHAHFERACSARQPGIGSKSFFFATYYANSWSNCGRIAHVCRVRLVVCEKTRVDRHKCELIIASQPTNKSEISQ